MNVIVSLSNMFFVNLYWILFLVPGFGGYLFLKNLSGKDSNDYFSLRLVYSFFISCTLFLPISIAAYFFTVGTLVSTLYFIVLILLGIVSIIKLSDLKMFFLSPQKLLYKISHLKPDFWTLLVIIMLALDFILSAAVKGYLHFGFDTWIHMAKINMDVFQGFSKFDPYLIDGTKNIIQSNYPSNIVHVIMAFPGKIFGVNTIWTWAYSVSFFRYITLAVVYVFARQMTKNKNLAIFTTIFYYFGQVFSLGFMIPTYPTFVAFLVAIFTLQVFFDLEEEAIFSTKINYFLYIVILISLSLTHQIISNIFTLFLAGFIAILWIAKKISFRKFVLLGTPLLLTLPTSVFTLINSKYVPQNVVDINNNVFHLTGRIYALQSPTTSITLGLLVAFLGLYLSFKFVERENRKILLFYAVAFNIVLLYTPLFMLVNKFLPTWGIVRYDYFNALFTLFLTALVFWFFISFFQEHKPTSGADNKFMVITALLTLAILHQTDFKTFYDLSNSNETAYRQMLDLQSLSSNLPEKTVVMADADVSFSLPSLSRSYVAGLDDTRTTDSIDTKQRDIDMNNFFKGDFPNSDKLIILKKYNASFVILTDSEKTRVAAEELGLTEVKQSSYYHLYKVSP